MSDNNLIFDLGFHNGEDSNFYLAKGFRVIAVEANPELYETGMQKFSNEIEEGKLILLHKAISEKRGKVNFYVHATKTEWSSCLKIMAESDGSHASCVEVDSICMKGLFDEYGVPHYLKVDVEGYDSLVGKQVSEYDEKPKFISFETSRKDYPGIFSYLYVAGYERFQLINQANHPRRSKPPITKEGNDIAYTFSEYSSGYFGEDLNENRWMTFDETITRYVLYKELKRIDNIELGLGWLDVHARML